MALAHPSLSTIGRKRGKTKFKNADEARRARELDASWKELEAKWGVEADNKKRSRAMSQPTLLYTLSTPAGRNTTNHIPSRVTPGGHTNAVHKVYTGNKILGIGTLHKSNAVPIFSGEEAQDIAKMRR